MHSLVELCERWVEEATEPFPPEKPSTVAEVFKRLGFDATPDVLALYGAIGGMKTMANDFWRLWPLEEIASQEASAKGIAFSDYCISCWEYRLRPVSSEKSAVYIDYYDGNEPLLVAASLDEFFDRYSADSESLLNQQASPN